MMMLQFQQHITNLSNVVTQMQTHLVAQQQIADKKMDAILEKLNRDPSPRRHDSSSSRPYPRQKSTIPRCKSGSDLRSNNNKNNTASQIFQSFPEILIPVNAFPSASTQSEQ